MVQEAESTSGSQSESAKRDLVLKKMTAPRLGYIAPDTGED